MQAFAGGGPRCFSPRYVVASSRERFLNSPRCSPLLTFRAARDTVLEQRGGQPYHGVRRYRGAAGLKRSWLASYPHLQLLLDDASLTGAPRRRRPLLPVLSIRGNDRRLSSGVVTLLPHPMHHRDEHHHTMRMPTTPWSASSRDDDHLIFLRDSSGADVGDTDIAQFRAVGRSYLRQVLEKGATSERSPDDDFLANFSNWAFVRSSTNDAQPCPVEDALRQLWKWSQPPAEGLDPIFF